MRALKPRRHRVHALTGNFLGSLIRRKQPRYQRRELVAYAIPDVGLYYVLHWGILTTAAGESRHQRLILSEVISKRAAIACRKTTEAPDDVRLVGAIEVVAEVPQQATKSPRPKHAVGHGSLHLFAETVEGLRECGVVSGVQLGLYSAAQAFVKWTFSATNPVACGENVCDGGVRLSQDLFDDLSTDLIRRAVNVPILQLLNANCHMVSLYVSNVFGGSAASLALAGHPVRRCNCHDITSALYAGRRSMKGDGQHEMCAQS